MQADVVTAQAISATEIIITFSIHETGQVLKTRGSARRIRKRRMQYTNGNEGWQQHVVAIVGRVYYIHQPRSKKVRLPLSDAGCFTVHGLSVLCHKNGICSTWNACMRGFGPCFNHLLKPLISPSCSFSCFQSRTFPQHVLSATLDLSEQPGLGLCSAFLLRQLCHYMWDFQVLTNMDIPAKGLSILAVALKEDHSYTSKYSSVDTIKHRVHISLYFVQK